MPSRSLPPPTQMKLPLEERGTNRPPTAPPTPEVMAALAELLLAALGELKGGEAGDEPQDRR